MSEVAAVNEKCLHTLKWYYWPRLSLLPDWRIRQPDKHNTWNFHFHWLCFRLWTMDSPAIGFQVELDDLQLQIRGRLPYLIFGLFIPVFPINYRNVFWRKAKR